MTDTFFNLNWCQKKIFWGICIIEIHAVPSLQNVFDKRNLIPSRIPSRALILSIKKIKSVSTRTTSKEVTNGLSPVKRAKRKRFSSSLEKNVQKKSLPSFLPVLPTSSILFSLLDSLAPTNSFVWARKWVMKGS